MILKSKLNISGNTGIPPVVTLKQFDKTADANGKQLQFELYDGATLYAIPSGAKVTFRGTKPDLTAFDGYECSFTGSTVTVNVQEQMTVCAGRYNAELRITKSGNILGTANVTMSIERSAVSDGTPVSKTDLPLIEKAAEAYDKVAEKVSEASASASSAKASADKAATSEKNAKASETNSASSASASKKSADNASVSEKAAAASASGASASASEAKASASASASSATASANSATASANSAQKAKEAYEQASAIAGVGEFAYYVADDGMLHFKFKKGGI